MQTHFHVTLFHIFSKENTTETDKQKYSARPIIHQDFDVWAIIPNTMIYKWPQRCVMTVFVSLPDAYKVKIN